MINDGQICSIIRKGVAMSENRPRDISDDQFEQEVLKSSGLSVVDFWTLTCGTCHQMAPALDAFAAANGARVKVFKVDA